MTKVKRVRPNSVEMLLKDKSKEKQNKENKINQDMAIEYLIKLWVAPTGVECPVIMLCVDVIVLV